MDDGLWGPPPAFRARIWGEGSGDLRGYCYFMEITDAHGCVVVSDNTGSWRVVYDQALGHLRTLRHAWTIGVLRQW